MASKRVKLRVHAKTYCEKYLIVNVGALNRDKLQLAIGDIVEITPCVENGHAPLPGLCLQIEDVPQEIQTKGGPLSVSREIAGAFNLEGVREVYVRRVERVEVGLDLVELRIKDQCLTRSDMWRVTSSLTDSFVHVSKKLEHAGVRVTVSRLWSSSGEVVSSGAVLSRTRVVFRSASVQLFLYLQISREMWEFDQSGDLYFDKAVGGFLTELFQHWQEQGCNHEVTLVFFWRIFYDQAALNGLPDNVKSSVQKDKRGRSYEDFYKVITVGECVSDWSLKLVNIKQTFVHLKDSLAKARGKDAEVCSAPEGNLLEAINMAVNVFLKHYTDCHFSLTGHQIIIVTAGAGMFEVDHELTRLTNERVISGGVATDLVCLTEQPLHAVPLLKFQNQDSKDDSDYYNIPHWINYSFYSPSHSRNRFRFQPRLQISDHLINHHLNRGRKRFKGDKLFNPLTAGKTLEDSRRALEDRILYRVDYDEYDAAIFSNPNQRVKPQVTQHGRPLSARNARTRYHSTSESVSHHSPMVADTEEADGLSMNEATPKGQSAGLKHTGGTQVETKSNTSHEPSSFRARFLSDEKVESPATGGRGFLPGSAESLHLFPKSSDTAARHKKSLINPFDPTLQHLDQTAYHRRWMHVFPRNKSGIAFQVHHVIQEEESHDKKSSDSLQQFSDSPSDQSGRGFGKGSSGSLKGVKNFTEEQAPPTTLTAGALSSSSGIWMKKTDSLQVQDDHYADTPAIKRRGGGVVKGASYENSPQLGKREEGMLSDKLPTENFSSARRLGADWRSLSEPACLPITTDFYPSHEKLTSDYFEYPSKLVASTYSYGSGESTGEKTTPSWITDHQDVSTFQVFSEMISQRLSQGFQLVFERGGSNVKVQLDTIFSLHKALAQIREEGKKKRVRPRPVSVRLSLGRVFQKMELNYPDLVIWIYRPKSRVVSNPISTTYQLSTSVTEPTSGEGGGQGSEFIARQTEFSQSQVEDYNWNYLDQHICGYSDFEELGESQKYWRCRYLLLPSTKLTGDSVAYSNSLIADFVRFLEFLNHIKRGGTSSNKHSGQQLKRQASIPVLALHSRVSTPSDTHSLLLSPRPSHKLLDIGEESPRPRAPSRSESSPVNSSTSAPKTTVEEGLKISEYLSNRPLSPRLASSQPKSGKGGVKVAHSITNLSRYEVAKKESDSSERRGRKPAHRRTSSHDLDNHQRSKVTGSPQLVRRTAGEVSPATSRQDLSFASTGTSSPSHSRGGRRGKLTEGGVPVEVTPPTPSDDGGRSSEALSHDSFCQLHLLNSSSPVQLIAKAMECTEDGIDFLDHLPGLNHSCFIAMEAVSWVMEKLSGVETRSEAVKILQNMMTEELVVHASGDVQIPFIDGYFIYQLPRREKQEPSDVEQRDNVDKSFVFVDPMDYEKFTRRWFEVKVHHPLPLSDKETSTILAYEPSPASMSPFAASFRGFVSGANFYMHLEGKEDVKIPASMLNRYVEVNPDPQGRSDRPEWCYVHYNHAYRPNCAFQLEFQWMVTTMNLLNQLIKNWLSKAIRCGFNLVPAPMLQSITGSAHPFNEQHFIPLLLPLTFPDWTFDATPISRLFDAIITRFCFLLDPGSLPQSSDVLSPQYDAGEAPSITSRVFIHQSGVALIQPACDYTHLSERSHDQAGIQIKGGGLRIATRHLSLPIGSSTPLLGSPTDGLFIPSESRRGGDRGCGFYWYKNYMHLRQNPLSGVVEEYDRVLAELTEFCRDEGGGLTELCGVVCR